jgi:hypothetical protein
MTDSQPPAELTDLEAVEARIDEARAAEDHLLEVMPSGIQPDDDAYAGMSGPTEGETEQGRQPDDEREARSDHQPLTQQMQDEAGDDTP